MAKRRKTSSVSSIFLTAAVIVIFLIGFRIFLAYDTNRDSARVNPLSSTATPQAASEIKCQQYLLTPSRYTLQDPINSFYGLTFKDGQGKICSVFLGPNYKMKNEGFTGEQIQINMYDASKVTIQMLVDEDKGTLLPNPKYSSFGMRYSRSGYGGEDQVLVFHRQFQKDIVQIIWRNQPDATAMEKSIHDLVIQFMQ